MQWCKSFKFTYKHLKFKNHQKTPKNVFVYRPRREGEFHLFALKDRLSDTDIGLLVNLTENLKHLLKHLYHSEYIRCF